MFYGVIFDVVEILLDTLVWIGDGQAYFKAACYDGSGPVLEEFFCGRDVGFDIVFKVTVVGFDGFEASGHD